MSSRAAVTVGEARCVHFLWVNWAGLTLPDWRRMLSTFGGTSSSSAQALPPLKRVFPGWLTSAY
jgi:hypothetical protein